MIVRRFEPQSLNIHTHKHTHLPHSILYHDNGDVVDRTGAAVCPEINDLETRAVWIVNLLGHGEVEGKEMPPAKNWKRYERTRNESGRYDHK